MEALSRKRKIKRSKRRPNNKESVARKKRPRNGLLAGRRVMGIAVCSIPTNTCMNYADWGRVEKARTTANMVSSSLGERQKFCWKKRERTDSSPWELRSSIAGLSGLYWLLICYKRRPHYGIIGTVKPEH